MAEEVFAISDEGSGVAKEIVTPEMVDLQLESFDEIGDFSGYEWSDKEIESEAASEEEPSGDPRDEPCGCRERVHVESSPGRWIDKIVKRGGCCG